VGRQNVFIQPFQTNPCGSGYNQLEMLPNNRVLTDEDFLAQNMDITSCMGATHNVEILMLQIFIKDRRKSFEKGFIVLSKIRFRLNMTSLGLENLKGWQRSLLNCH
jgi:hypothetical protein